MDDSQTIVLGSQSPQRLQLLKQLVSADRILVRPPLQAEEVGFSGLTDRLEISERLAQIARTKNDDVAKQGPDLENSCILTADTIIIVKDADNCLVLGKPDGKNWQKTVHDWFMNYYSDTIHEVVSGVCIRLPDGNIQMAECSTTVKFKVISHKLLDWYLSTEEPLGKAGGYGIQSAGSIFVESIHGSLSNVIGLPLELIVDEF
ncbi:MAG: Maf family protein [Planctomicrobium sp.]|jgi:septum formation protein|nr:Maf family protein [Planctomicrobium sp.]